MYGKLYENNKVHTNQTNYIYCSVCDSLVFISGIFYNNYCSHNSHLKRCISENTILNEYAKRMKFFKLLIEENFRSGNINNTYYKKRLKLIIFNQSFHSHLSHT